MTSWRCAPYFSATRRVERAFKSDRASDTGVLSKTERARPSLLYFRAPNGMLVATSSVPSTCTAACRSSAPKRAAAPSPSSCSSRWPLRRAKTPLLKGTARRVQTSPSAAHSRRTRLHPVAAAEASTSTKTQNEQTGSRQRLKRMDSLPPVGLVQARPRLESTPGFKIST